MFDGQLPQEPPTLGGVSEVMKEHARLLTSWLGETPAMRSFRRHATWYTKGFRGSAGLRQQLMQVATLAELDRILEPLDKTEPFPAHSMRVIRGKGGGTQVVSLPDGYRLLAQSDEAPDSGADAWSSGG
jgi:hypothetical protein